MFCILSLINLMTENQTKHKPAVWCQTFLTAERVETFRKSQTFSSCRLCLQCSFASRPQLPLAAEFKKTFNILLQSFFVPHVKLEQILIFTFRVKDVLCWGPPLLAWVTKNHLCLPDQLRTTSVRSAKSGPLLSGQVTQDHLCQPFYIRTTSAGSSLHMWSLTTTPTLLPRIPQLHPQTSLAAITCLPCIKTKNI